MDKRLGNFGTETRDLSKEVSLLETLGEVKPFLQKQNFIFAGVWSCALILTNSLSSQTIPTNLVTTLNYPNRFTQSTVSYNWQLIPEEYISDDFADSELFVATQPEKSYYVELTIVERKHGGPVIELEKSS